MATIHELHKKLVNKEISAVELTNAVIAHKAKVEPTVHAYLSDSHERALATAKLVDEAIAKLNQKTNLDLIRKDGKIYLGNCN